MLTDGPSPKQRSAFLAGLLLLIIVTTALRLAHLGRESLWYDEIVTAQDSRATLSEICAGRAGDNGNPPGFWVLTHLWRRLVGGTDKALRLLPLLIGIAGVLTFWGFARQLIKGPATWIAAGFVAISPSHISLSQELRMYSLLFLVTVLILWTAWHYSQTRSQYALAAYAVAAIVGLYTHYYSGLVIGAVNLWMLLTQRGWKRNLPWFVTQLVVALAFVPWLPGFLHQLAERRLEMRDGHTSRLQFVAFPLIISVGRTLVWKHDPRVLFGLALLACSGLLGIPTFLAIRKRCRGLLLLGLSLVAPAVVVFLMAFVVDIHCFDERKALIFLPAVAILFAQGVMALKRRYAVCLVAAAACLMLVSDFRYHTGANRDDWRSLASVVSSRLAPDDVVVFYPDIGETSFQYYAAPEATDRVRIASVNRERLRLRGVSRDPGRPKGHQDVTDYIFGHKRIWLVLNADALAESRYEEARAIFAARTERIRQWRYARRLDLYLLSVNPNATLREEQTGPRREEAL